MDAQVRRYTAEQFFLVDARGDGRGLISVQRDVAALALTTADADKTGSATAFASDGSVGRRLSDLKTGAVAQIVTAGPGTMLTMKGTGRGGTGIINVGLTDLGPGIVIERADCTVAVAIVAAETGPAIKLYGASGESLWTAP